MRTFFYVLSAIGAVIGGFILLTTLATANGAPQEASGAAIAVAFAVLPYCFARAVDRGDTGYEKKVAADLHLIAEHYRQMEKQEKPTVVADPALPPMRSQPMSGGKSNPFMPSRS